GAQILRARAWIQQACSDECDEALEFMRTQIGRMEQQGIKTLKDRLDGPAPISQVAVDACRYRIIFQSRFECVQVMVNGIFQPGETSIVKECRLERDVSQWRAAEFVTVGGIARDLLQTEVLILPRSIENYIALPDSKLRRNLRYADDVHLEITEH